MVQLLRVSAVGVLAALTTTLAATTLTAPAQACQPYQLTTMHLSDQTAVAVDGGIVMVDGVTHDDSADLNDGSFVMVANGKATPHEELYLARGLTLWRSKFTTTMKLGIARSEKLKKQLVLPIVEATTALAAPTVASAIGSTPKQPVGVPTGGPYGEPYTNVSLHLGATLPDDAIALVVYQHRDGGSVAGLTWSRVAKGQVDFELRGGGKGCGGGAPPLYIGDKLSFGYVTTTGRVSPQTKAQLVKAVPPMKRKKNTQKPR